MDQLTYFAHAGHEHASDKATDKGTDTIAIIGAIAALVVVALVIAVYVYASNRQSASTKTANPDGPQDRDQTE